MKDKVFFISLGCDKNRIDAEIMANTLEKAGFQLVDSQDEADCAIVNTCGFIDSAKEEAIEAIFDMVRKKQDPECSLSRVIVTGCLAQRYCEELAGEIPEVDAVVGIGLNGDIASTVRRALAGERTVAVTKPEKLKICGDRFLSTPAHYAYLKIAEGCDNRCTYCAIPMIRGAYRSRPPEEILLEAEKLVSGGVKELILVAQDTTSYGIDLGNGANLASLLRQLCRIEGLWTVSILYAYPDRIDDQLIDCIAEEKCIAKYLDIPLQHANTRILKLMRRFGDADSLAALMEKLRSRVPGITLRTTFLVGFPSETRQEFEELLDFAVRMRFDRGGAFAFSMEEGTPAVKLGGDLPLEEKQQRQDEIMQLLSQQLAENRKTQLGRQVEAICDGFDEERGMFIFRSEQDAPEVDTLIYALGECLPEPGEVKQILIEDADDVDLFGRIVG